MTTSLPDVNVWLAVSAEGPVYHKAARDWFAGKAEKSVAFCRVTQMGLLRLLTNSAVMGGAPRSIPEALAVYSALKNDGRVTFLPEPKDLELSWTELMSAEGVGPSSWTDGYLAAFAREHGATLTTLDAAFKQWKSVAVAILT